MKKVVLLFLLPFFLNSCHSSDAQASIGNATPKDSITDYSLAMSNADTYVKIALEVCECMQPMVEKTKEIRDLEKAGSIKTLAQKEEELSQIRVQVDVCSTEIRKKYGTFLETDNSKKKLLGTLKKYCPDSYAMVY